MHKIQINLIDFDAKYSSLLTKYLDLNRQYNIEIDPLHLRSYDPEWGINETNKILAKIGDGSGYVKFINVSDLTIGMIYYYVEKQNTIHLSKIFIEKDYRGKGYGKATLDLFLQQIKSQNFKYINLNVFAPNENAIKLYKSLGFQDRFIDMLKVL